LILQHTSHTHTILLAHDTNTNINTHTNPAPDEVFKSFSHADVMYYFKQCNYWRRQGAQCCQIGTGEVSYQMLKMIVFGGQSTNDSSLYSQSLRNKVERKGEHRNSIVYYVY